VSSNNNKTRENKQRKTANKHKINNKNSFVSKEIDEMRMRTLTVFFGQFCDVAKVAMAHRKISPDLFLFLKNSFYILSYILEPCVEIQ
jgi:hypothetical protein